MLLQALQELQFDPPRNWLVGFLAASYASAGQASPRDLTTWLAGLAAFGITPAGPWLDHYASESNRQLARYTVGQLVTSAWSVSQLAAPPHPLWLQHVYRKAAAKMGCMTTKQMAHLLLAAAKVTGCCC